MSTKGKRMAGNSGKEGDISPELINMEHMKETRKEKKTIIGERKRQWIKD